MRNKKTLYLLTGILLGLTGGFLYWKFVGCTSGTCPLTSKWHMSTLFGGVFGYLLADSIKIKPSEKPEEAIKNDSDSV